MPLITRLLLLPMLSLCWVASAWAQELPPAPADGVLDDTRALSQPVHEALARELSAFRQKTGIEAWFVATTFLPEGQTLRSHSRLLRQAWSQERAAVLFLYDRSKGQEMVSLAPPLWQVLPTAGLISARDQAHEKMLEAGKSPEQRLQSSMSVLLQSLLRLHLDQQRASQTPTRDDLRLLRWLLGFLVAGGLIGGIAGRFSRRRHHWRTHDVHLPRIQVPTRLGAPHGGGTSASWPPR